MSEDQEFLLLKALYDSNIELSPQDYFKLVKGQIGWGEFVKSIDYFHSQGITDPDVNGSRLSDFGQKRYKELLAIRELRNTETIKKGTDRHIDNYSKVGGLFFAIMTFILTIMLYCGNKELTEQKSSVEVLKKQTELQLRIIDSLNTKLFEMDTSRSN